MNIQLATGEQALGGGPHRLDNLSIELSSETAY